MFSESQIAEWTRYEESHLRGQELLTAEWNRLLPVLGTQPPLLETSNNLSQTTVLDSDVDSTQPPVRETSGNLSQKTVLDTEVDSLPFLQPPVLETSGNLSQTTVLDSDDEPTHKVGSKRVLEDDECNPQSTSSKLKKEEEPWITGVPCGVYCPHGILTVRCSICGCLDASVACRVCFDAYCARLALSHTSVDQGLRRKSSSSVKL